MQRCSIGVEMWRCRCRGAEVQTRCRGAGEEMMLVQSCGVAEEQERCSVDADADIEVL
mgnify:CR=1 FL=1